MHNLLRCRRGSAAFATVVALVPLIGVVALGAEAGSWYVTKQHAQNAADAAAYSGALTGGMLDLRNVAIVIQHKTMSIVASNLQPRTRSATLATPPIPAPIVLLASDRYDADRADRSADSAVAFVPLLASNSQDTWRECLVCFRTASTSALKPSPKSRTRKTYVFWDLDRQITHLQSAAVAP